MNNYNEYEEFEENIEEENLNEETPKENKKQKNKKAKKVKNKKIKKTKTKKQKPKTKVIYKDKKSGSGILIFFLILIILGLLAVLGYLVYINYYAKEEPQNNNMPNETEIEKTCEATATKYSISSGLKKCPNDNKFKLTIKGTNLSFDVTRTNDNKYIINTIYYKDNKISANTIIGIKINNDWKLKEKDNIIYLLFPKEDNENSQILIAIKDGNVIFQDNASEYNLGSNITYTKYTELGLEEINTCEYYETNNLLDNEMWTKGELVYENNQVIQKQEEVVTANDICKK